MVTLEVGYGVTAGFSLEARYGEFIAFVFSPVQNRGLVCGMEYGFVEAFRIGVQSYCIF